MAAAISVDKDVGFHICVYLFLTTAIAEVLHNMRKGFRPPSVKAELCVVEIGNTEFVLWLMHYSVSLNTFSLRSS